jgi:hypothetical protein
MQLSSFILAASPYKDRGLLPWLRSLSSYKIHSFESLRRAS